MDLGPRIDQEDCILVERTVHQDRLLFKESSYKTGCLVMVVCDGMGGHDAGEEASRYVCDQLNRIVDFVDFSRSNVRTIINSIQKRSFEYLPEGSGTTLSGIIIRDGRVIYFNAGDSRVYRLGRETSYISHDHSFVQDLIDKKMLSEKDAFVHPYRNVVNYGIGPAFKEVDLRFEVNIFEEKLEPNAVYMLCSDGVSDLLTGDEIHRILKDEPLKNGKLLHRILNEKKLKDNTSFIILEVNP
jgi:serine/threonine protein phosphatase PrpC